MYKTPISRRTRRRFLSASSKGRIFACHPPQSSTEGAVPPAFGGTTTDARDGARASCFQHWRRERVGRRLVPRLFSTWNQLFPTGRAQISRKQLFRPTCHDQTHHNLFARAFSRFSGACAIDSRVFFFCRETIGICFSFRYKSWKASNVQCEYLAIILNDILFCATRYWFRFVAVCLDSLRFIWTHVVQSFQLFSKIKLLTFLRHTVFVSVRLS